MKTTIKLHLHDICIVWLNLRCRGWCWLRATANEQMALCVQELSISSTSVCYFWMVCVSLANRVRKLKINEKKRQPIGGKALVKQEGLLLFGVGITRRIHRFSWLWYLAKPEAPTASTFGSISSSATPDVPAILPPLHKLLLDWKTGVVLLLPSSLLFLEKFE